METELAPALDIVMMQAKRIYILIIKVNKLFSFFSSRCFLKGTENMYSVFLSSYTNTHESLGELEKAVETLACGSRSHSISRSPKLRHSCLYNDRNTVHVFYFLNTNLPTCCAMPLTILPKVPNLVQNTCSFIKLKKISLTVLLCFCKKFMYLYLPNRQYFI